MKKNLNFSFEEYSSIDELTVQAKGLLLSARSSCHSAYAPYSNFQVGAAVLLSNGTMVLGSNQENEAYPSGLCAERVALFSARSSFPNESISAIAIASSSNQDLDGSFLSPCGACRQVMIEYQKLQTRPYQVIIESAPSKILVFESCEILLPFTFRKRN